MSIESSRVSRLYFPHINLLRGFAAMSVLVYHIIEHYSWKDFPTEFGLIWFKIGWMSVDLFFVISGFVIAWSLIQLHQHEKRFGSLSREFLWRRGGRIIPLYIVTMAAYALLVGQHLLSFSTWPHWLAHLAFLHPFHPGTFGSINGVNWSVGIEVHFYLFALITSPWWVRRKPLTVLLSAIAIAWSLRSIAWVIAEHFGFSGSKLFGIMVQMPLMLDEFGVGMALALLLHHYPPNKWAGSLTQQGWLLFIAAIALVAVALKVYWLDSGYWHNPYMVILWRSLVALAIGAVILFFIWLPAFQEPPLLYKAAYYIGDISYGIYLWHLPVILLWKPYLQGHTEYYLIAVVPCVLTLSALSWHLLEKPMIRWSKEKSRTR